MNWPGLGAQSSCALLDDGRVLCWGSKLHDGYTYDYTDNVTPTELKGADGAPLRALGLSISNGHSCAVLLDNTLVCWGANYDGQLGNGFADDNTPVGVSPGGEGGLAGGQSLSLGENHSCALLDGGDARCWGENGFGQLGNQAVVGSTPTPTPVVIGGAPMTGASAVALGRGHTCALMSDSSARCWGSNGSGELGSSITAGSTSSPLPVKNASGATLTNIRQLALGGNYFSNHSCALMNTGGVLCWGENYDGQLGNGTTSGGGSPWRSKTPPARRSGAYKSWRWAARFRAPCCSTVRYVAGAARPDQTNAATCVSGQGWASSARRGPLLGCVARGGGSALAKAW